MVRDRRLGSTIGGRFRVEALLGEGQMARVYLAEQVSMHRQVALKIIHPDLVRHPVAQVRFRREVEAVTRLRSPHTIVFYDFGATDDGSLYIAMELLDGQTLRGRLEEQGALSPAEVLAVVRPIASCLFEAHEAGVLHRDLKPENVFLCAPEPGRRDPHVKVLDFGLARVAEPVFDAGVSITSPSVTVGTPAYMAPEVAAANREVDARSDLYSLGVIVYELLVGARPFEARNPHAMMLCHTTSPVPMPSRRRPGLPPGCDAFIALALAKDPDERFQTAEAMAHALGAALGDRRGVP
jgi:serine/threonine-protein kinase